MAVVLKCMKRQQSKVHTTEMAKNGADDQLIGKGNFRIVGGMTFHDAAV